MFSTQAVIKVIGVIGIVHLDLYEKWREGLFDPYSEEEDEIES